MPSGDEASARIPCGPMAKARKLLVPQSSAIQSGVITSPQMFHYVKLSLA
jgi:hypothetical protein